jgi:hypothetical protein
MESDANTGSGNECVIKEMELLAVRLKSGMDIRPASQERAWMGAQAEWFPKRCLPMLLANQAGWELINPVGFTAVWDGSNAPTAITISSECETQPWATSHFGLGILTWNVPFLFRTPRGYNLLVRGPANCPKDGISALEGIVETDWTMATFTMNWKFTRAHLPISFESGEAFAMVVPICRGELERFRPILRSASSEPMIIDQVKRFAHSRLEFIQELKKPGSSAERNRWQRHYMLGRNVDGTIAPEHQTRLQLAAFQTDSQGSTSDLF